MSQDKFAPKRLAKKRPHFNIIPLFIMLIVLFIFFALNTNPMAQTLEEKKYYQLVKLMKHQCKKNLYFRLMIFMLNSI